MKFNRHTLALLGICAGLLIANATLQWLVDENLGVCWTHNVMRNWEQAGFWRLKGQMVENPGGHDVLENPAIYTGHSANSLYPAFVIGRLFRWAGWGAMPYHLLVTLGVMISIWYLLGGNDRALLAAALAILTPGFVVEPTQIDPNAVAILGGFIYAAFLWWWIRLARHGMGDLILFIVLTIIFTSLNWTTALVQGQLFVTLLVLRAAPRRRLVFYAVGGAVAAVLVVAAGLLSKLTEPARKSAGLEALLQGYLWGEGGYANGSGTATLLVRLAFINGLALLPIWIFWLWNWLPCARRDARRAVFSLAPLVLAVAETVGMRNYFSHHPWMAAPLLLLGCVLSLMIIMASATADAKTSVATPVSAPVALWKPAWTLAIVAAFGFGLAVLTVYREHEKQLSSLVSLVRRHTARSDEIVVVAGRDAGLANETRRLKDLLDRWIIVTDTLPERAETPASAFLLSAKPLEGDWKPAASNAGNAASPQFVDGALEWFMKNISRRKPGDRMEMAETYYLYPISANVKAGLSAKDAPSTSAPSGDQKTNLGDHHL